MSNHRKIRIGGIAIITAVLFFICIFNAAASQGVSCEKDQQAVPFQADRDYILQNDRLLVSTAWLDEQFGFYSSLAPQAVTLTLPGKSLIFTYGQNIVQVSDGSSQVLGVAPVQQDGLSYLPLRFVLEYAGGNVDWDAERSTVLISSPPGTVAFRLTILHSNDIHSHLDLLPEQAAYIKNYRSQYPDSLLLNAGDNFTGTMYYTYLKGQAEQAFLNQLGYDYTILGNHEFDDGDGVLASFVEGLKMPVLAANVSLASDPDLGVLADGQPLLAPSVEGGGRIYPYAVANLSGHRIGIIGLTTPDTLTSSSPGKSIGISSPETAARQAVTDLEKQGINNIVVISHIGWDEDIKLAGSVPGIDVIIGGHSHTVPEHYPTLVGDPLCPTLIVQAGCDSAYLGFLQAAFDSEGHIIASQSPGKLIAVGSKDPADPDASRLLASFDQQLQGYTHTVLGKSLVDMPADRAMVRSQETLISDLVADAILESAASYKPEIALYNAGSCRGAIQSGDLSASDIMNVIPYNNNLLMVDVQGSIIEAALENGLGKVETLGGGFPVVAGMRYAYNPALPAGHRLVTVDVLENGTYKPLDSTKQYRVITNDWIIGGGDGYTMFKGLPATELGVDVYTAMSGFIQRHTPLNPQLDGRIKSLN